MSSRSHRQGRALLAVAAAAALTAGVAAGIPGSASAASQNGHKLPSGLSTRADLPKAKGIHKAPGQVAQELPAHGRLGFLLKLDVRSTAQVSQANAGRSTSQVKAAARAQMSTVSRAQSAVIGRLPAATPVLYRTHALMAGVAVVSNVKNAAALARIPGVAHVYPIAAKSATNAYAVPLQGAPQVWENHGNLGQHTSIAIIDTGIDYTHANFGGPGTTAAYDAAKATDDQANPDFPTSKVVAGYDFAGDDYNADVSGSTPAPDPNPLDCGGHGSHVAGTAAGLGVNADGSTYTGSYNTSTPFDTMRIGPGMAPDASLYAYKVFGCEGTTNVVGEALDRAMDPNNDGDTSDHVDVINMSLGSDYGFADDGDSELSNAASEAGITVAVASGNGGDFQDIGGSPGNATRTIAVANSEDASSIIDGVSITIGSDDPTTYGASRAVLYDWSTKPDLTGDVVLSPADNQTACTPYSSADAATITGKVVLVKWTQEALECGSIARGANLRQAGASGFIFANSAETFDAGINGDTDIPGVLITKSGGDAIRDALNNSTPVTVNGTSTNAVNQMFPEDNDKVNDSSSRGIHAAGNVKPDVTAVGTSVFSTAVGTGDDGVSFTGTSMATPMVAGLSSLVVSAHPNWTPEQVKADIMNTAGQDLYTNGSEAADKGDTYAPNRVGAGRIEAGAALDNDVLAYNADDAGAVSVSFGPMAVSQPTTMTKTIKVQNTSLQSRSYDVSYDAITSINGVDYTVSPSSVTVDPRSTKTVTLTLSIPDPNALNNSVDPTIGRTASIGLPRDSMADASGRVLFTPTSGDEPQLRVPVYSAPRPASTMTQAGSVSLTGSSAGQTGTLALTGGDLGWTNDDGTSTPDTSDDYLSLGAGFMLAASSPKTSECSATVTTDCWTLPDEQQGDVRYVGYTAGAPDNGDNTMGFFAINTWQPTALPTSQIYYQVDIDTTGDGEPDYFVYNNRLGTDDLFVATLVDTDGHVLDQELLDNRFGDLNAAVYDSDTVILPIWAGAQQWNPTSGEADGAPVFDGSPISYGVSTYSGYSDHPLDTVGETAGGDVTLRTQPFTPAVTVGPGVQSPDFDPLFADAAQNLTVTRNPAAYKADGGQGLLMVHLHNANGNKAQVVKLTSKPTVTLTSNKATVKKGKKVTLTVKVADPAKAGTPSGKVTITDQNGKKVGSGTLGKSGGLTVTWTPSKTGTFTLKASYAGDASYVAATSGKVKVKVTK